MLFLIHLSLMLPDDRDREILLCYLAAMLQYPGRKFRWCVVLQGVQGNGKSMIIDIMSFCVGDKYTFIPNAQELGSGGTKFNAWITDRLFIGLEEVFVGDRRDLMEALKPIITGQRIEVQSKGTDQKMADNRANFVACTNHKGGLLIDDNERRYCMLFTAQQNRQDMINAGFVNHNGQGTGYFYRLYNWLENGGYEYINHFLRHYRIQEDLNPATVCERAPITSSTKEAVQMGMGKIEQEVIEARETGIYGFKGDWISSLQFDILLEKLNSKISRNLRKEKLTKLGYIPHPGLTNGRTNNVIMREGGKPRLYVLSTSPYIHLNNPADITNQYLQDQGGMT